MAKNANSFLFLSVPQIDHPVTLCTDIVGRGMCSEASIHKKMSKDSIGFRSYNKFCKIACTQLSLTPVSRLIRLSHQAKMI